MQHGGCKMPSLMAQAQARAEGRPQADGKSEGSGGGKGSLWVRKHEHCCHCCPPKWAKIQHLWQWDCVTIVNSEVSRCFQVPSDWDHLRDL